MCLLKYLQVEEMWSKKPSNLHHVIVYCLNIPITWMSFIHIEGRPLPADMQLRFNSGWLNDGVGRFLNSSLFCVCSSLIRNKTLTSLWSEAEWMNEWMFDFLWMLMSSYKWNRMYMKFLRLRTKEKIRFHLWLKMTHQCQSSFSLKVNKVYHLKWQYMYSR